MSCVPATHFPCLVSTHFHYPGSRVLFSTLFRNKESKADDHVRDVVPRLMTMTGILCWGSHTRESSPVSEHKGEPAESWTFGCLPQFLPPLVK